MKKLVIVVSSALLLSACGGNSNSYISSVSATGTPVDHHNLNPPSNSLLPENNNGSKNNLNNIPKSQLNKYITDQQENDFDWNNSTNEDLKALRRNNGYQVTFYDRDGRKYQIYRDNWDHFYYHFDAKKVEKGKGYIQMGDNGSWIQDDKSSGTGSRIKMEDGGDYIIEGFYFAGGIHTNKNKSVEDNDYINDSYSTFGLYAPLIDPYDLERDMEWIAYAGGDLTASNQMPMDGNVTYKGLALGVDTTNAGTAADFPRRDLPSYTNFKDHQGVVTVDVDFLNSKVLGDIDYSRYIHTVVPDNPLFNEKDVVSNVTFNADIKDSYFFGRAENTAGDQGDLYGQFNGPNAGELAGYYESDDLNGMTGSFAAGRE